MPSDTFTLQIFDTGISIPALHASSHLTGGADVIPIATASTSGLMSAAQAAAVIANTAKVTNATHTGEVTGSTALTIVNDAVTTAKINNGAVTTDKIAASAVDQYKIADGNVTLAKLANVDGPVVLGRSAPDIGGVTAISCTTAGFALIGQPDVSSMQSYLGLTFPLSVEKGGTNLSSYAVGDIIYASGGTTLSKLPDVIAGNVLLSGGVTTAPAYGKVALSGAVTHVTGVLPVANGGTGLATITGYVKGAGTTALATSPTIPVADISGVLPIANGGTGLSASGYGQVYFQDGATSQSFISNTFAKITASTTTFDSANSSNFSNGASTNRLTYTGAPTRRFYVYASCDMTGTATDQTFAIAIAKSGVVITATECRSNTSAAGAVEAVNDHLAKLVCSWIIELAESDYVEVFACSRDANVTGTPRRMPLVATPVY